MPRNPEVYRLKAIADQAFAAKQAAYDRMEPIGQHRHDLNKRLNKSWDEVCSAREEMNSAYERQQVEWESYKSERDSLSAQIDAVARDANRAHEAMRGAFDRASDAYNSGDKASALLYASEGRGYQYERNSCNEEKGRLISIAKSMTPPSSDFHRFKERYNNLMDTHKALQAEYKLIKSQYEMARDEFSRAKKQCDIAKAAFERIIEAERAKWHDEACKECGATIRVNIEWSHPPSFCKACKEKFKNAHKKQVANVEKAIMHSNSSEWGRFNDENARIKPRNDGSGKVDVYYGGLSADGDGLGHGHVVIQEDQVVYLRGPWQDKRTQWDIDDSRGDHTRA
ncbi:MAG: putative nuclear RNA export factor SDE5 [Candidatus Nomurabacteria bacterium]|jgi:chromosome segregation ATPase|nr:putative nuclear RNA export factor SDE5 [Candidatus Nomurabacteria bacterium]